MLLTYASSEDDDTQSYAFLYVLYSLGQQENASLKAKFSVVSSSVSALDEHAHYLVAANTSFSRQASVFMIVRQRGAKVWLHTKTIITFFQLSKLLYFLIFYMLTSQAMFLHSTELNFQARLSCIGDITDSLMNINEAFLPDSLVSNRSASKPYHLPLSGLTLGGPGWRISI